MPLSYKIIKSCNISCGEVDRSFVDTKIDYSLEDDFLDEEYVEFDSSNIVNIDKIKEKVRRELFVEYENEGLELIKKAKFEAENLILVAKQKGLEEGLIKGYEEGYKKGIDAANLEGSIIKNNALELIEQAKKQVSAYISENHDNIIKLAGDMAESIVQSTIDESTENILMLIKPILQQFGKKESIIITCHPSGIAYIKSRLHELENSCPNAKLIILEDRNLEKNGCIIENENEIVDLQIKKQINSIIKKIEDVKNMEWIIWKYPLTTMAAL